jgi:hypothetical protein
MSEKIFSYLVNNFAFLSLHSRARVLEHLLIIFDSIHAETLELVIDLIEYHYWDESSGFITFMEHLLKKMLISEHDYSSPLKKFLANQFNFCSNCYSVNAQMKDIGTYLLKHIATSIENYHSCDMYDFIFRKSIERIHIMDDDTVTMLIEYMLRVVCDITIKKGYNICDFWKELGMNGSVNNIIYPSSDIYDKVAVFDINSRQNSVKALQQIFDTLMQYERSSLAGSIYRQLCFISSWTDFIDASIRLQVFETLVARETFDWIEKSLLHNVNLLDHIIFAQSAIIKYDSSILILYKTLQLTGDLLKNRAVWYSCSTSLKTLADTLNKTIVREKPFEELPVNFKKADLYAALYQLQFTLFQFHSILGKSILDGFVSSLLFGLGRWPTIAKVCLQGLSLVLYELPTSVTRFLPALLMKISQVTSSNLAQLNLELITSIASLPNLHVNFTESDYKRVFGIALTYLREQENPHILGLAYYATQIWFLSLKASERKSYVPMIISTLLANTASPAGNELNESVEMVRFNLMCRY